MTSAATDLTVDEHLLRKPRRWLVTGAAGFIGSALTEKLLQLDQQVVGLDNFATGSRGNLDDIEAGLGEEKWSQFHFLEGDIRDTDACAAACKSVDIVLHQAALGSVPRSIADPLTTTQVNIDGFVNILVAARDARVTRFVYASSSSVYGDDPSVPKTEPVTGQPLSPYAITKCANEFYARVFANLYGLPCIGLRYFNVFGRRQSPNGAYAAVIPRWIGDFLSGTRPTIHGDGTISRDFCYIDNVIQANLLAATVDTPEAINRVYNVACGERMDLNALCLSIRQQLARHDRSIASLEPIHAPPRPGDIAHSLADVSRAQRLLGYVPRYSAAAGIGLATDWYWRRHSTTTIPTASR
jgi:UDP-N-acetylglucosamine 4-epimerase